MILADSIIFMCRTAVHIYIDHSNKVRTYHLQRVYVHVYIAVHV